MTLPNGLPYLNFGGPANYRVVVQGKLQSHWSDRLAGMAINDVTGESGQPRTALEGLIRDQAELNGVLETLYGLHLPIIRVEHIEDDE